MLNKIYPPIITIFSTVIIVASILIVQGQTAKETSLQSSNKKQENDHSKFRDTFFFVEYSNQSFLEDVRKLRGKKYDYIQTLIPETTQDYQEYSSLHWSTGLPALPIDKSQVIVIGRLVNAQAHLSSEKKSVYTEFKIEVEKTYKNSNQEKFESGKYVIAEREGGVVRFPSGYKAWFAISGQQMPKIGTKYLFFLTHEFPLFGYQKQDLLLLTAYELKNGKVYPLDNPNGGTHPISKVYREKEELILFNDLESALKP